MKKIFIEAKLQKSGDKITFVASDETLDRAGEVVPISSWDLTNFMLNPVLLVDHDYSVEKIVGRASNIRIENKQLLFEPEFHNITELAKTVDEMVNKEILNTVSVGFIAHGPIKDGDTGRNELLEISFVAVPANPSAQRLKSLIEAAKEKTADIEAWTKNKEKEIEVKKNEDGNEKIKILETEIKDLLNENAELKEGRVLSGKNRKLVETAVSSLKQLIEVADTVAKQFDELLTATDSPSKANEESREPKVDDGASKRINAGSRVRRALQKFNRDTNRLLSELKD